MNHYILLLVNCYFLCKTQSWLPQTTATTTILPQKGSCGHTKTMDIEWPSRYYLPRQLQLSFTEVTAVVMRTLRPLLPPSAATTTRCRPEARARSWHHMPGCASSCYSTTWTNQSSPWLTLCWYSCLHPDSKK